MIIFKRKKKETRTKNKNTPMGIEKLFNLFFMKKLFMNSKKKWLLNKEVFYIK